MYKVTYGSASGYFSAKFHQRLPLKGNLRSASDKTAMATNFFKEQLQDACGINGMLCHVKYETIKILKATRKN